MCQMTSNLFLTVHTVQVGTVSYTYYTFHIISCKTAKLIVRATEMVLERYCIVGCDTV